VPDGFKIGPAPILGKPFHLSQPTPYTVQVGGVQVSVVKLSQIDFRNIPDRYLLDIDSDYFSNSGWDTRFEWGENSTRRELVMKLQLFVDQLFQKQSKKPALVTIAASPGFTPWEDLVEIQNYFRKFFVQQDYIFNEVNKYQYHYDEARDRFLQQEIRSLQGRADGCVYSLTFHQLLSVFGAEDLATEYPKVCKKF